VRGVYLGWRYCVFESQVLNVGLENSSVGKKKAPGLRGVGRPGVGVTAEGGRRKLKAFSVHGVLR
jgi:hypothetical protein